MTQVELRETLHKIDHRLRINSYDDGRDVFGVYFGGRFVCSIPRGHVYLNKIAEYCNESGVAHRTLRGLYKQLKALRIGDKKDLELLLN